MLTNFMEDVRLILCEFLRGVMMYSSLSADRVHGVRLLFKDVEKMICDIHSLKFFDTV